MKTSCSLLFLFCLVGLAASRHASTKILGVQKEISSRLSVDDAEDHSGLRLKDATIVAKQLQEIPSDLLEAAAARVDADADVVADGDADGDADEVADGNGDEVAASATASPSATTSLSSDAYDYDAETEEAGPVFHDIPATTQRTVLNMYENTPADIPFAEFSVLDADKKTNFYDFSFYVTCTTADVDPNVFYFNDEDELLMNISPDFEARSSYEITVKLTDNDYAGYDASADCPNCVFAYFEILIVDINDNAPESFALTLDPDWPAQCPDPPCWFENAQQNAYVATLSFLDQDSDEVQAFSYSIGGPDFAYFDLSQAEDSENDDKKATLYSKQNFDYENNPHGHDYHIDIRVSDGSHESMQTFIVRLKDTNDNAPENIQCDGLSSTDQISFQENSPVETMVCSFTWDDQDTVGDAYATLNSAESPTVANNFRIKSQVQLLNKVLFDFEDNDTPNQYSVPMQAEDGVYKTSQTFTVKIRDLNDNAVTSVEVTGNDGVTENLEDPFLVATLKAIDADSNDAYNFGQQHDMAWISDTNLQLKVVGDPATSRTFEIWTTAPIDYEQQPEFILMYQATDGANQIYPATITIQIHDVNDNAPSDISLTSVAVDEDADPSTLISPVVFRDLDNQAGDYTTTLTFPNGGANSGEDKFELKSHPHTSVPYYKIVQGEKHPNLEADKSQDDFCVTSTTPADGGKVFAHHIVTSYTVEFTISDGVHSTDPKQFIIYINDVNDHAPEQLHLSNYDVEEYRQAPLLVGEFTWVDLDDMNVEDQTLTVVAGGDDTECPFNWGLWRDDLPQKIVVGPEDTDRYENTATHHYRSYLATTKALDFETKQSYEIEVTVSDGTFSLTVDYTIVVLDLNDNLPTLHVAERVECGDLQLSADNINIVTDCEGTAELDSCYATCAENTSSDVELGSWTCTRTAESDTTGIWVLSGNDPVCVSSDVSGGGADE